MNPIPHHSTISHTFCTLQINYNDFLAATIQLSKLNREEQLIAAFKHFDKEGTGFITREDIIAAMKQNDEINVDYVDEILRDIDVKGNGKVIKFSSFRHDFVSDINFLAR